METPQQKNIMHWLLIVLAIAAAVVLLAKVLDNPPEEDLKRAATLDRDDRQAELEPMPSETKPAEITKPSETAIQPPSLVEPRGEPPKEREYSSDRPLYFRVVFGEGGTDSTLGVVDESAGTGTGYDVAYVDENRNGDLTDDAAKKFPKYERGSRTGQTDPRFVFNGPFEDGAQAKYTVLAYSLFRKTSVTPGDHNFHYMMDTRGWNYFFINGRMKFTSTAAEALKGPAVTLAGKCDWQISSASKNGRATISAALKDKNGCTLRGVRLSGRRLSPRLSLIKDGKVEMEKDLEFG